jgi:hypothetical protein
LHEAPIVWPSISRESPRSARAQLAAFTFISDGFWHNFEHGFEQQAAELAGSLSVKG